MEITFEIIIILMLVAFTAGTIDSIAGGGGLLTVPSLLLAGLSPQIALGTNKFMSTIGTSVAVTNYILKRKVVWKVVLAGIVFTLMGSLLGTHSILLIPNDIVGKIMVFLLPPVAIIVMLPMKKERLQMDFSGYKFYFTTAGICFFIGFYDGFFGPGTGTFLIIALHYFLRMNLSSASATARIFNFGSNIAALVTFLIAGKVIFTIGLPMAVGSMTGNFLGSHLAIKKGQRLIRIFLILALTALLISLIIKYF